MTTAKYISTIVLNEPIDPRSYLSHIPAIKHLSQHNTLKLSRNITFFVGENGTGKSTLLEAIAVAYGFNAEGGTVNFNFSTRDTHSDLYKHLLLGKRDFAKDGFFLRAESLYNVATNIEEVKMIGSYGGISLHNQSHGESFLSVVQNRFSGHGLYILDEPEAALSPMKLLTLMAEINYLVNKDSQFIIATHSPILMAMPEAQIIEFSKNGLKNVNYQDTEHFKVTKSFLNNPDKMLKYLFEQQQDTLR